MLEGLYPEAKAALVDKGFVPEMGARPLRHVIEESLEDPLAEQLLLHPGKGPRNGEIKIVQEEQIHLEEQPNTASQAR